MGSSSVTASECFDTYMAEQSVHIQPQVDCDPLHNSITQHFCTAFRSLKSEHFSRSCEKIMDFTPWRISMDGKATNLRRPCRHYAFGNTRASSQTMFIFPLKVPMPSPGFALSFPPKAFPTQSSVEINGSDGALQHSSCMSQDLGGWLQVALS